MVARRPIVFNEGLVSELSQGDTVSASFNTTTEVVAGSGLSGGGVVSAGVTLDVSLAPNPSGLIFVGDSLGINGATQALANAAVSSGTAAISVATNALASGNNSIVVSNTALASGNAALTVVSNINSTNLNQVTYTAASAVVSGYAVGVDGAGRVQSINRLVFDAGIPARNSPVLVVDRRFPVFYTDAISSSTLDNSFLLTYRDIHLNLNYGTAKAGVVNGTSVSVGTATVFNSAATSLIRAVFLPDQNKHVILYKTDSTSVASSVVAVVSGTNNFFGSAVTVMQSMGSSTGLGYDPVNAKLLAAVNQQSIRHVSGFIGTVSGLSVSYTSSSNPICSGGTLEKVGLSFDTSTSQFVGLFSNPGFSFGADTAAVRTISISGTSIITGPVNTFANFAADIATNADGVAVQYSAASNRHVCVYTSPNLGPGNTRYFSVRTSGTSVVIGPSGIFPSNNWFSPSLAYDSISDRALVTYNQFLFSLSFSGEYIVRTPTSGSYAPSNPNNSAVSYNVATNRSLVTYSLVATSGQMVVVDPIFSYGYVPRNSVGPNILGVAQSTVASGSPCIVNLPGSIYTTPSGNFSTGAFYYADPTTSGLTTSAVPAPLWSGQTPWNYVGRAVSASGIMVLKTL